MTKQEEPFVEAGNRAHQERDWGLAARGNLFSGGDMEVEVLYRSLGCHFGSPVPTVQAMRGMFWQPWTSPGESACAMKNSFITDSYQLL